MPNMSSPDVACQGAKHALKRRPCLAARASLRRQPSKATGSVKCTTGGTTQQGIVVKRTSGGCLPFGHDAWGCDVNVRRGGVLAGRPKGGRHHIVVPLEERDKVLQEAANADAAGHLFPTLEEENEDVSREEPGLLDKNAAECETGADEPLIDAPEHTLQETGELLSSRQGARMGARPSPRSRRFQSRARRTTSAC